MGRVCLIFIGLTFLTLTLSAQYLEFVENKGQWDPAVKFRALLTSGAVILEKGGFSILQQDTTDLRRIHRLLHGETLLGGGSGKGGGKTAASTRARVTAASGRAFANPGDGGGGAGSGDGGGSGGGTGAPGSGEPGDPYLLHSHIYRVSFENANVNAEIVPEKAMPGYNNYIIGNGKNRATNCSVYQGVVYKDLYPGIDMHYYTEQGFIKYDLIVHPGADPNSIVLRYDGQSKLSLRKNQVLVQTSVGTVKELEPRSYQLTAGGRTDVKCSYTMPDANHVRFKVENYSADATLVIDPTEIFCSFTGSKSDNWGYTATYDKDGNFFLGGIVLDYSDFTGNAYGTTPGAFQATFQGGDGAEGGPRRNGQIVFNYNYDIGIMKFNPDGRTRLWATYLGGKGNEQPHSLICDPQGNLILTGRTSSVDFPPVSPLATFGPCKGLDIFVAKLSANGSTLMGSMKIGGSGDDGVNNSPKYLNAFGIGTQELRLNYGDDGRSEVILDAAGNIYVAASTRPEPGKASDFPVTGNAFQPVFGGGTQDGVLLKLSPDAGTVLLSSFIGGSGVDAAFVLALNPTDNSIYVAGGTTSKDLKGTGNGTVVRPASKGDIDGFVSIISNSGGAFSLIRSTYFGTDDHSDMIYGISFDKKGFPYIMGTTYSVIPVVNSPFNQSGTGVSQASGKQFITKLQPDLSSIIYSANFGPAGGQYPNISPTAFLVDRCENVYVSGWGGGIDPDDSYLNSGTNGLTVTSDNLKATTDGADFYFFVLKKNASTQLFGSFFGQQEVVRQGQSSLGDHVDGGTSRFDEKGVIYQAICANCGGLAAFPVSRDAAFKTNGALPNYCNEAALKIAFDFAGVAAGLKAVTHGRGDSVGCVPLTVSFQDTVKNAKQYVWKFGDGTIVDTTAAALDHTYTAVGDYQVMLIAIDSNSCNVADTVYRTIIVRDNPAFLDFRYDKTGPCDQFNYLFTNLSSHASGAPNFTDTSFTWNFGDGPTLVRGGITDKPTHSYGSPGPYNVTLQLVDTSYCNYPQDTVKLLNVAQNVKAQFTTPAFGCTPYMAVFTNTSIAGQKFYWNFGDGSPIDSSLSPSHLYTDVKVYTVTLTAIDSATCNIIDTYSFTVTVQSKPVAGYTFAPLPPQPPNTPTIFTDASTPAIKYEWSFGDGKSEVKTTPDTVMHQYNKTDTFRACLVVTNESGCTDTVCHDIAAIINPLLDVPNAFTPGRFGQNGIVKVVGFGIEHMTWRIYNRWGQKVFESNDPYIGWDGTFKGQLQPMDVYGYTLEVGYSDGTHTSKKGDITLIR